MSHAARLGISTSSTLMPVVSTMHILTVVADLDKGGTQRAAQNFAEAYRWLGHDSRVLATRSGGVRHEELARESIPVWVGMEPNTLAAIRQWQPEVVHIHSHGPRLTEIRAILDHAPEARILETNVFSKPSPWVGAVDVSFQLSTWCSHLYARRAGARAPSAVVPNPVKVSGFRRAPQDQIDRFRAEHRIEPNEILIGRIGQADESKWSSLLVRTFEHLGDHGIPAKLVVVNAPPGILAACRASPHASKVVMIDKVIGDEALSIVYSAIDLFVHVADVGESFGLVLAESMLCESPVVTLSTPWKDNSQGEVVGHGVGGLVATTPAGFIDAALTLCRDPARRRELGRCGRERILERYDSIAVARQALEYATVRGRDVASAPNRSAILAIYRDAADRPSRLTTLVVDRLRRLELTRYTTGYEPWSVFVARCGSFAARRCGFAKES